MEPHGQSPDLQSILATLARFVPPAEASKDDGESTAATTNNLNELSKKTWHAAEETQDPRLRPQTNSAASPRPVIDPATITTWQDGLRCVTKIAAQNDQFAVGIQRMIEDQRKHEMHWYQERQKLKQRLAARVGSIAKAQSILQSLNNIVDSTADAEEADDPEVELAEFDRKIYAAQQSLEISVTAHLKRLGVPFFGTDRSLIFPDQDSMPDDPLPASRPKWSPRVTEEQMLELQRRMVKHLEDLYKD